MSRRRRILLVAGIMLLGVGLRNHAVMNMPFWDDEPGYLLCAQHYASALRAGDVESIYNFDYNREHPAFAKLIYGLAVAQAPEAPHIPRDADWDWEPPDSVVVQGIVARYTSLFFGALLLLLVAWISPLAGLFLAIHTYSIKFSALVTLEPVPMLMSAIAVLAYIKSRRQWGAWLLVSGIALGLCAASKFIYAIAGLAIVADFLWHYAAAMRPAAAPQERPLARCLGLLLAWGLLSIAIFVAANPYLWPNPPMRLWDALQFHAAYSQGAHVQQVGHPFYQPLVWLFTPDATNPAIIFTRADTLVSLLALLGVRSMWQRQRVIVLWWLLAMIFLLLWPTKWSQYILITTVPVVLCAAHGTRALWTFARPRVERLLRRPRHGSA